MGGFCLRGVNFQRRFSFPSCIRLPLFPLHFFREPRPQEKLPPSSSPPLPSPPRGPILKFTLSRREEGGVPPPILKRGKRRGEKEWGEETVCCERASPKQKPTSPEAKRVPYQTSPLLPPSLD